MICKILAPLLLLALTAQHLHAQALPHIPFTLGIASYAYRQQDLAEVIRSAHKLNIQKLALKSVHLPLECSDQEIEAIRTQITEAGLDLYAGSVIYMTTEQEVHDAFAYARRAGMELIVGVPNPELLDGRMEAGDYRTVGALYEIFPPEHKKLKPLDSWNRSRIVSKDGQVEHWLNGVRILSYERGGKAFNEKIAESKFRDVPGFGVGKKGPILLQDHGSEVCFRNIKIRNL